MSKTEPEMACVSVHSSVAGPFSCKTLWPRRVCLWYPSCSVPDAARTVKGGTGQTTISVDIYALYIDLFTQKEGRPETLRDRKKAEPLGKGWMRGRVGGHRACRRERVRTGGESGEKWEGKEKNGPGDSEQEE